MYVSVHPKYQLFLSDFNKTRIFSTDFRKILNYQTALKSITWRDSQSYSYIHDKANTRSPLFTTRFLFQRDCPLTPPPKKNGCEMNIMK